MPRAFIAVRHEIPKRRQAVITGLQALGYSVTDSILTNRVMKPLPTKGLSKLDLLVLWNRGGRFERMALDFEKAGGSCIILENGYAASAGTKTYALALFDHNGNGWSPVGSIRRWNRLNVRVSDWRKAGSEILICRQRGIGSRSMAQPYGWTERVQRDIKKVTDHPVRVREHPAVLAHRRLECPRFEEDTRDAYCIVTFSSGAANDAIINGIPVFYLAPHIIMEDAAKHGLDDLENPFLGCREAAFAKLAWAQWTCEELSTGEPFNYLIERIKK